eukprot:CAMPEP_0170462538 /NCGR_PEP_ID=MMETSP0123-20130129/8007_1 /TAXON_ID=182087 /ORGANISM="Favella ehrenbergii, Strain Fehren 1" /LENGTH=210 /DNA_ID=CAMNT_0010727785 /DNA_START=24 /DNA_END=656 /DNA_ORIENTATION=-
MKFALASILAVAVSATSLETASFWMPTKPTGPALTEWGIPENSSAPDFFGDLLGGEAIVGQAQAPSKKISESHPKLVANRTNGMTSRPTVDRNLGNTTRAPTLGAIATDRTLTLPPSSKPTAANSKPMPPQQQAYAPQQQAYAPPQKYTQNGNYNPWGAQQSRQQVSQPYSKPESKPISQTLQELMLPSSQEVPILSGGDFPDSDGQMMP